MIDHSHPTKGITSCRIPTTTHPRLFDKHPMIIVPTLRKCYKRTHVYVQ